MSKKINIKNLRLYLRIGAVYLGMAVLADLMRDHKTIGINFLNDLWRTIYIVALSILLYEYIIPYIRKKKGFFRMLRSWEKVSKPVLP